MPNCAFEKLCWGVCIMPHTKWFPNYEKCLPSTIRCARHNSRYSTEGTMSNITFGYLLACLTSQQHASVSQGRIRSDNFTCCHTEIEVADPTFQLTQSQYIDNGPTSPSADPITPAAWQGSHWSANFKVTGMTRPRKNPAQAGFEPGIFSSRGGRLYH